MSKPVSRRESWNRQSPKEDRTSKAIRRRKAIKEILTKSGAKGIIDIRERLQREHGISVSRATLYHDMANLGGIDDADMGKIELRIVGLINSMLKSLKDIADKSEDEKNRIAAINSTFQGIKTLYGIANAINQRSGGRLKPGESPRNITPQVVVRIGGDEVKKIKEKND